jgi:hypothetical protein
MDKLLKQDKKMSVECLPLFPIEIFKTKCSGHEKIKEYLMKHAYPDFQKRGPNSGLQQIYTDYLPGTGAMVHWPYMYNIYKEDVNNILSTIGFDMTQPWNVRIKGWYNFTTGNETEWIHDHVGGASTISFSFVHYVVLDEKDAGTVFLNPHYKSMKQTCPTKDLKYLPDYYMQDRYQPSVEEGDILFFPSWLDHTAPRYSSNKLRVVNACNIMLRINDNDGF